MYKATEANGDAENNSPKNENKKSPFSIDGSQQKKVITMKLVATIIGAAMGSLQFGYNLGVINAPESLVKSFMNETNFQRSNSSMSDSTLTNLWATTVAIYSIGGCFGGFAAGWWATRFGRRGGCLFNIGIGVVAAALMFASRRSESYELIIVGRLLIGVHCGLYTGLVPLYLSEISTPSIRGAVGVVHQLGVVTALLISQILGFPIILGNASGWDILLGLAVVPCIIQGLLLPFCPESPRYLFITKGDEVASRNALVTLRDSPDVDEEIEEMKTERSSCKDQEQLSIMQLLMYPSLRQPLIIGVVMQLSQQLSGINGVFFYSTSLFRDAGQTEQAARYTTSAVGATMVAMTLITIPLMDRVGRRTLHLAGLAGMMVLSVAITFTLVYREDVHWFVAVSIVLIMLYVMFFALGPGSIPWLIISELFAHDARPAAMSICVLVNWTASFAVGYCFTLLQSTIKDFIFLPFTVFLAGFVAFTFFKVPETKGKTFEEIQDIWRK